MRAPTQPLPEPIRGCEPDSFAFYTFSERLPDIARRVLADGDWIPQATDALKALIEDMPHGRLKSLGDHGTIDEAAWERYLTPYLGQTWLEAPWFFSEPYFFRGILKATRFFHKGPGGGVDPYAPQKKAALAQVEQQLPPVYDAIDKLSTNLSAAPMLRETSSEMLKGALVQVLRTNIWGNRADLSLRPNEPVGPGATDSHEITDQLIVDNSSQASDFILYFPDGKKSRIDIILDNGGIELAYDLFLAGFLLDNGLAARVHLHCKPHPTYVSDATIADVLDMVAFFNTFTHPGTKALWQRLQRYLTKSGLVLQDNFYWTSPLSGWEMPDDLYQELSLSNLIVLKGDANYRRLLGDRHWPFTTPLSDILGYLPAPTLALRVLKSNVVAGLSPNQVADTQEADPDWLYNGKWGVIQFLPGDE